MRRGFSHETGEFWCDAVLCTREEFEKMYAESKGIQKKYPLNAPSNGTGGNFNDVGRRII